MHWYHGNRPLRFFTSLFAVSLLVSASADAQRKKPPKKKPGAAATARPAKPAVEAAPEPAPEPAPEAAPAPEPAPEPAPAKPRKKRKVTVVEETEETTSDTMEEDTGKEKEKEKATKAAVLLDVALGPKGFRRNLSYQGDVNNVLPDYALSGAPAIELEAGIYPIRTSNGNITVGITGSFEKAFAVGTTYAAPQPGQGGTHSTSEMAYSVGARGNYHFGLTNTVGLGVDYGVQSYTVDLPAPSVDNAQVPDVEYHFIRPNLVGRFGIANRLSFIAGLGYMFVSSAGEIVSPTYFRSAITKMAGYELDIGVGWAPFEGALKDIEIRPMIGWRHYAYVFNIDPASAPSPSDPYIASGAHDDFYGLALLVGYRM